MDLQSVKGKIDFAIITLREDELRAVLERFPGETGESQNRFYRLSRVSVDDGTTALVAIARAFEQGTGEAQTVARHIIDDLAPHWILVVGIAGGIPDFEYTLGDVVLSTRVNDLTVHALHETAPDQFAISGGPSHYEVTKLVTALPMLESRLQGWNTRDSIGRVRPPVEWSRAESFYGDERWQERVKDSLMHHFAPSATPRDPVVRAGPINSSDALIKDTKTLQQWLSLTRNALAVEMEAGGVYRAVRSGAREYPFLSIRGLSDIVGFKRHPDWTEYACHSAAAFTLALIKSALVKHRPEAAINPKQELELPERVDCFGRDGEQLQLRDAICAQPSRFVVVLGPPGIGKTNLTKAVLHDKKIDSVFGARRYFVELATANSSELLKSEIANKLGIPLETVDGSVLDEHWRWKAVKEHLGRAPALLILDNAETPWYPPHKNATQRVFSELQSLSTVVLVCSMRLEVVPDFGRPEPIHLRFLDIDAARELFCSYATRVDRKSKMLHDLLVALGGWALAIRLLALRASSHGASLEVIWDEWQKMRTALLQKPGLEESQLDKESSLMISLELSIHSPVMTDAARQLLALLAWLPQGAGIKHETLNNLLPGSGTDAAQVLLNTGLAFYDANKRLQIHDLVRDHVERKKMSPSRESMAQASHYFRSLARNVGPNVGRDSGGKQALAHLMEEMISVERFVNNGLSGDNADDVCAAVDESIALSDFMRYAGHVKPELLIVAKNAAGRFGDLRRQAECLHKLGVLALARPDHLKARESFEQALALYRQLEDVKGEARCIQRLGDISLERAEYTDASRRFGDAYSIYIKVGTAVDQANCIGGLAEINFRCSAYDEARNKFKEALSLYDGAKHLRGKAHCFLGAGMIAIECREYDEARNMIQRALELYVETGNRRGEANCYRLLGQIDFESSVGSMDSRKFEDAGKTIEEAKQIYEQIGGSFGRALCVVLMGEIELRCSRPENARGLFEDAFNQSASLDLTLVKAHCLRGFGDIELAASAHEAAFVKYEDALSLYQGMPSPYWVGEMHKRLAQSSRDVEVRRQHLAAARHAWRGIGRQDLIDDLDDELGEGK
ncbi:phosphorylase family protein [Hyalangium versicolor]|uniref:phosphorylase family protein n=1 Tax=Hyalangium versicolor TaxID=2861190 RepID=UPI001CCB56D1|nr:AAA family ATPase [Hyalangium versicolor]